MMFGKEIRCDEMKNISKHLLSFDSYFVVEALGMRGGLVLLWNLEVSVEIHNYSQRYISVWITNEYIDVRWLFTDFYGQPKVSRRKEVWKFLHLLNPLITKLAV